MPDNKYKKLRERARALLRKQGAKQENNFGDDWDTLIEELNIYQLELEQQNAELRELQEKAEQQKNEYIDLFEFAPNAYFIIDRNQHIEVVNKKACSLLEATEAGLKSKKLSAYIHPDSQDDYYLFLKNARQQQQSNSQKLYLNTQAGHLIAVYAVIAPYAGSWEKMKIALTDITTERNLEIDSAFKADILENINECVFAINNYGKITYWNKGAQHLLGHEAKDMIGKNPAFIFENVSDNFFRHLSEQQLQAEKTQFEWHGKSASGARLTLHVHITRHHAPGSNHPSFIVVAQDISIYKEAEKTLKKSNEQGATILNSLEDQIYITDARTYDLLFANELMKRHFPEIEAKKCSQAIFGFSEQCRFCKVDDIAEEATDIPYTQEVYNKQDKRWYKITEKLIQWAQHKKAVIHTLTDITDIKQSEKELRENEEMLSKLTLAAKDGIIMIDDQAKIKFWNPEAARMFGYTSDEILGKNIHQILAPQDMREQAHKGMKHFAQTGAGDVIDQSRELQAIRKDGTTITAEISVASVKISGKWNAIGIIRDISQRKQEQLRVSESEKRFRTIVDSVKEILYIHDFEGNFIDCNQEMVNITGYEPGELKKMHPVELLAQENQEIFTQKLKALDQSDHLIFEAILLTKSGEKKPMEINANRITYNHNEVVLVSGRDISERLKNQKALKKSEERYANLIQNIGEGIAISDEEEIFTFCNSMAEEIFGVAPGTLIGRSLEEFSTKEQFKKFRSYTQTRKTKKRSSYQAEIISGKGKKKTIQVIASPYYKDDVFRGTFAAFSDITKQKEAEKALIENEHRYRTIFNNVNEALYIYTIDGKFIDCNRKHMKLTGYSYDEMLEMPPGHILAPEAVENFNKHIQQLLKTKYLIFETAIHTKSGTYVPVEVSASVIDYKNRKAILISGRDITERLHEKKQLEESELRFRTMADNIPDAIYIHQQNGQMLDTNQKAIEMLGHSREELLKMTPVDISSQYSSNKEFESIAQKLQQNDTITFEDTHITSENKKIPVEITAAIIQYKNRQAIFAVAHDISERKEAEKAQSKLIDQLNYLSNSATEFISIAENEEIYRYLGKSLSRVIEGTMIVVSEYDENAFNIIDIFGVEKETLQKFEQITQTILDQEPFYPPEERLALYKTGKLERVGNIQDQFMHYFDEKTLDALAKSFPIVESRIIGVTQNKKLFAGISILFSYKPELTDIEFIQALVYQASIALQRKNYENDLVVAKTQAEIANKAKSTFLTNISHEIRTPLNTIMGFTEILYNSIENEQKRSYLKSISASGKSLLTIINDILDLSRIESGNMSLNFAPMSISTLLTDVEYFMRSEAENKGLEFKTKIDENTPELLRLDQPRLRQIVHNLVSNAIKFTKKGTVQIQIETHNLRQNKTDLQIQVKDTGIGISKEKMQQILEPFQQGDARDARKYEGSGMGLSIANKLTPLLNGKLHIDSETGKGSTFTVYLKNVKIETQKTPDEDKEQPEQAKFNNEKILLVEEDVNQMEIIQSVLARNKLITLAAETGEQALAFANEFQPELIIIDLTTQTAQSTGTAKNLREMEPFYATPIIGIIQEQSANLKKNDAAQFFTDFIQPPLTEKKLLNVVIQFIKHKTNLAGEANKDSHAIQIENLSRETQQKLISRLDKETTPIWNDLHKRQPLNKVKQFKNSLEEIAEEYNIKALKSYCAQLQESLKAFDIIHMRQLLKKYNSILNAIKNNKE